VLLLRGIDFKEVSHQNRKEEAPGINTPARKKKVNGCSSLSQPYSEL
jgi:hypothetical protein